MRNVLCSCFSFCFSKKEKIKLSWIKHKLLSRKIFAFSQKSNQWRNISHKDASVWAKTEQNLVQRATIAQPRTHLMGETMKKSKILPKSPKHGKWKHRWGFQIREMKITVQEKKTSSFKLTFPKKKQTPI